VPEQNAPTPSQTIGPFSGFALPFAGDADGGGDAPLRIEGQVFDGAGAAVPGAMLEIWQRDSFARTATDASGHYRVSIPKPRSSPGPDGATLAPHLEVSVFARGLLRQLVTRIYFPDEREANAADPILARVDEARRATLVARSAGRSLLFDIHLQGASETVFFAL
jgi:protocatechuate 3,4-dioxygenase alpha subunit